MCNPLNCTNQQPPSYSGVTINIANPALNIPPVMQYGNSIPQYPYGQFVQGITNPLQKQQTNKMGLHAFAPYDKENSQNKMNLQTFTPTLAPAGNTYLGAQIPQLYGPDVNPNIYPPIQNNGYGINVPYYTPYINDAGYINPTAGGYNRGQNTNDYTPYEVISSDGNELMPAYPPQYYINNQTYPNKNNVNLLPQESQSPESKTNATAAEEDINTDTSKEIISELDERRAEEKELEKNGKKTKIISLTNEYIMSLENYLNNPNTDIRLMAAKEILTRLDEDRSRYDDAALNALLNKMLQDPNKLVRIAAMSAFSSDLASGNDYTVELLNKLQQNPDADPEDVLEASQILLNRAATTEVKYTQNNNQQMTEDSQ